VVSKKGQAFRSAVCLTLMRARVRPLEGPLLMKIRLYPPDKRKRDIDNIQKPLLDALEKGGAFYNDCQIKLLTTMMCEPVRGGKTVVCIKILKKNNRDIEIK
jgi:crossover junction endodeoxyribonuclease RusA